MLERCEVRAYAGVALKNAEGETIGLCSVMFQAGHAEGMEKIVGLLRLLAPLAGRTGADVSAAPEEQPAQPEHHHFLDTMMSHAPVGIGKVDLGGKILWANPAIEKMLGYSQEELQQLTVAEINHPDDWQTSIALYDAPQAGSVPRSPRRSVISIGMGPSCGDG